MSIHIVRSINKSKENQIEFLFVNFDHYDGIDLVAKIFCKEFNMCADDKIDGLWYSTIKLHDDYDEYDLCWHEDVGNYIVSKKQNEEDISRLKERLNVVIDKIKDMM